MPRFKISWGGSLTVEADDEEDAWNKFEMWTESEYAMEVSAEPRIEEVPDADVPSEVQGTPEDQSK